MDLSPETLHTAADYGMKRTRNFRAARLMFLRDYVGPYYDQSHGEFGTDPMNFAFNAIRAIVPNIVTRYPKTVVETDYLPYRQYAELLALSANLLAKRLQLPKIMQIGLVDSIFALGIFKTGLSTSDTLMYFGEEAVDPGMLYVNPVSLDNFTFDPAAKSFDSATFLGDIIRVERDMLLDSGLYDNAAVERLPSVAEMQVRQGKSDRDLSSAELSYRQALKLHDYVDLYELWLPGPQMLVTLPVNGNNPREFLRQADYYGPSTGPYTFLSLTPPVPGNPLPVALAAIWHDLHTAGNQIAQKIINQAKAQKNILGYDPNNADDAQELVDADDLDAIAMSNPQGAQMFSVGGQNPDNERMLANLQVWFNLMSGNTDLLGGQNIDTKVATVANILQQNAATSVTYMQDQVYDATTEIIRKICWYAHTDPLIKLPLIRREMVPAKYDIITGPDGMPRIIMTVPPQCDETQVFLTPEVRRGEFLDFAFRIEQQSMAPINHALRAQQLEQLAVKVFPAAAQAAMIAMQIGQPFSLSAFISRWAKFHGFEWIDEIFQDPALAAQALQVMQMGPQPSKGMQQNGGAVTAQTTPSQPTQQRQQAQEGANYGQAQLPVRQGLE